jgi:hypothetical protein
VELDAVRVRDDDHDQHTTDTGGISTNHHLLRDDTGKRLTAG